MTDQGALDKSGTGGPGSNTISGGVFFHTVVQGRDITVHLPPQITPALSGLPPASPTFTGREQPMGDLLQALAPGGPEQRPVLVAAVGLAGVGKTELVVQSAVRALKKPGWFPGGVLFVDMFGYDPERHLSPEHALDGLLRALGMPGEHIPAGLQDRSRLYRSVLAAFAEQGRRILMVIDNASAAEQARPLLPTDGTTATLLTSRHTLDIGARLHDLDTLDPHASVELLHQVLLQARGTADTRVQDAPEDAATIAQLCAGLPLALRIAAALLADTPTRPLASLARKLGTAHNRLDHLRREDRAVQSAFDLSYERLSPHHSRLFRLLSLNPGPDVSTESAARLADTDPDGTEDLLQDLARAHLVEPGHTWGRWRLHDLIRLYADQQGRTHADTDHRDAALTRLLDHYQSTTEAADTHLQTLPSTTSPRFPDRHHALAWLDDERPNLIATATATPPHDHPHTSTALAFALAQFLDYRRLFGDWITVTTTSRAIYRDLGDRHGEAMALNNLGLALRKMRRFGEAIDAHTQALAIYRDHGDHHREGVALSNLGGALAGVRRFEEAIDALTQAATIHHDLGDHHKEGGALNNLGLVLRGVRRFEEAINTLTQAATIHHDLGDRYGEGGALNNLGSALQEVRRFEEAIDAHTQALAIYRDHGDHHGEGVALSNLGSALREARRFEEAINTLTQAATIHHDLGDRYGEGVALNNLGGALTGVRRFEEAINTLTQGLAIYRDLNDRYGEGRALSDLGIALREVRRFEEAIDAHTQALAIYRDLNDHHGEGRALSTLGNALHRVRRFEEAINAHTQAATIYHDLNDHHGEGMALNNLGLALREVRRFEEAINAHTQAATIHRDLNDHHREGRAL
ncbi:tetratricopeptide repeat protein [Streptomyces sp. V4I2]|uniref:tetratricopeptide repeat protein n=1 Tax=Streptomyces sp. V4I2 TaxID=3042280 RepID=UPI00278B904A|nr:tetratricopeptide repeat protein [Streptomyces sp. V4I2]MDQ1041969.1 tetratricopeptide (TPR) repeat protein [Streptomyces sp. V4I2]